MLVGAVAGPLPVEEPPRATERRGGGGLRGHEVLAHPVLRPAPTRTTSEQESAVLKDAYLTEIRPYLARDLPRHGRLADGREAAAVFDHLRTVLPPVLHDVANELQTICEERHQLAFQKRLHHWLHGWLFVHVPLSMALLLLALVHAVISLRY